MSNTRYFMWPLAAVFLSAALLVAQSDRGIGRETVKPLLDTGQTILSQPIAYPTQSPAKIVSAIVTMLPGEETGWHQHDVPMFGYILEGEVTVKYAGKGTHVYRQGDALMEAIDIPHNGRNTGKFPARILAVFMGANGVPDTEMLPDYKPQ
ncbi:cupin domain-containing protein [Hyphomicrobium sp. xq]|uniref:Cupin domain-containing protein n=1 Tax=Hyphomicrobium album TaxID=2665159 RepID=A0A6I3KIC6_9HYPH|nr:cupin domain-containing protein [Hyphomicrobium album]MTD94208.1 cupin domain-containing protein [Hyphomicrobium album]